MCKYLSVAFYPLLPPHSLHIFRIFPGIFSRIFFSPPFPLTKQLWMVIVIILKFCDLSCRMKPKWSSGEKISTLSSPSKMYWHFLNALLISGNIGSHVVAKLIFLIADLFSLSPLLLKVGVRFNFATLIKCSSIWSSEYPDLYLTMLLMKILSPGISIRTILRTLRPTEYRMFKVTCGGWHEFRFIHLCESVGWLDDQAE